VTTVSLKKIPIQSTEKLGVEKYSLSPVEDFLKGKSNVKRPGTSEAAFDKAKFAQEMEILVLEHALFTPLEIPAGHYF
jgi:hypothetical protein